MMDKRIASCLLMRCISSQDCIIKESMSLESMCPTNAMLAVMNNPSYRASAFITRLPPVKILTAEFLHNVVNAVLEVIHST